MYVTNIEKYGYIIDTFGDDQSIVKPNNDVINKSLFTLDSTWGDRYLHHDFLISINNWEQLPVEEPCKWEFTFPFVNDKFCDELLNEVLERGEWFRVEIQQKKINELIM